MINTLSKGEGEYEPKTGIIPSCAANMNGDRNKVATTLKAENLAPSIQYVRIFSVVRTSSGMDEPSFSATEYCSISLRTCRSPLGESLEFVVVVTIAPSLSLAIFTSYYINMPFLRKKSLEP